MESSFTLPYSEYETIIQMQGLFNKKDGYSYYIPTSRQQKGIDFIMHNSSANKYLRVQVKSSRSYVRTEASKKENTFRYYLWFNNFINKFVLGTADIYLLFGLFPCYNNNFSIHSRKEFWNSIILLFKDEEMQDFLKIIKTKKEKKTDLFFGFGFDSSEEIFGVRGFGEGMDFSKNLLKNRLNDIRLLLS